MKKMLSVLLLFILLNGCSNNEEMQETFKSFPYEKMISFEGTTYVGTSEEVNNLGKLIGSIEHSSDLEEDSDTDNFSNYFPVGTRLYKIESEDLEESIAVEIVDKKFIKAINIDNM